MPVTINGMIVNGAIVYNGGGIDLAAWTVDEAATQRRRDEIRKARGWTSVPKVQRHDPMSLPRAAE